MIKSSLGILLDLTVDLGVTWLVLVSGSQECFMGNLHDPEFDETLPAVNKY